MMRGVQAPKIRRSAHFLSKVAEQYSAEEAKNEILAPMGESGLTNGINKCAHERTKYGLIVAYMPEGSYKKFGFENFLQQRLTFPGISHDFAKSYWLLQKTLKTSRILRGDMGTVERH